MSRIGKLPIPVPSGAEVHIEAGLLRVKGPKGELSAPIPAGITAQVDDGILSIGRVDDSKSAIHGLTRSLVHNCVTGVTTGFVKKLEIVGVGYRALVQGRVVVFSGGYSHPIEVLMPEGVDITVEAGPSNTTKVEISGIDKQVVGETAAKIRGLRKPDPYKQKGIRYVGEVLRKKEGKTGAA